MYMSGPLAGVRVIDLTSVGMGPYATQILGDMGADVIKVESPEGDLSRDIPPFRHPGMGALFLNLNRNKRSIVLDLKRTRGSDVLRRMVEGADVLISSIRAQSMRKLGLDYEPLNTINPRLIYCAAYGFSEEGPYAGQPAFDDVIQAMSGLAALQGAGDPDGPAYVKSVVADKTCGLHIACAVVMALYAREKTGRGQMVEVPMFETMVSFMLWEHFMGLTFSPPVGPAGYDRLLSPFRRPYKTKDGYLAVLPYTTAQWQRFFELAGRADLAADPRFLEMPARHANIDELYRLTAEIISTKTTDEWHHLLTEADVPVARVLGPEDLLIDPHLTARGFFERRAHPSEGEITNIGIPTRFSATPGSVRRLAPRLGEHSDEILAELGFDERTRQSLYDEGVSFKAESR
jgi:crotonobetainyl-CoA:carnitine CoA-transferase CaiB-like acyl-CoA transferase